MVKVQNFSENLDSSLNRLGVEVSKKIESPEFKEVPIEKIVKESLKSLPPVEAGVDISSNIKKEPGEDSTGQFLPSYLSGDEGSNDVKAIVENLINFAFKFGVERAIMEAKKYPPFVEDAFHDALVDKLVPELKKRGIIK